MLKPLKSKRLPILLMVEIASGALEIKTRAKHRAVQYVNQHIFPQTWYRGRILDVAVCRSRWVILRQNPDLSNLINDGVPASEIAKRLGRFISVQGIESPS